MTPANSHYHHYSWVKRLEFLDGGTSAFIGFDDRFVGTRISARGRFPPVDLIRCASGPALPNLLPHPRRPVLRVEDEQAVSFVNRQGEEPGCFRLECIGPTGSWPTAHQ